MENYGYDEDADASEEQLADQGGLDTPEEGFLQGYSEEENEIEECAECGTAIRKEKKLVREINEEAYVFCSKECAEEFEESLGSEE